MTEQESHSPTRHLPPARPGDGDYVVLPDIDFGAETDPGPAQGDAIQFERPRPLDWTSAKAAIDLPSRDSALDRTAPAPDRSTPRAGGSLPSWHLEADAWRLNRRLGRRQADLILRLRSAKVVPSTLRARFTAMGLPDDVVDETLGSIRRLDAWSDAWIETAQRYLGDFRRQVSAGNQTDGARNQTMAALCYHIAQIIPDPTDRRTAIMCRAAAASLFTQALPYVYPTVTRVTFPWRAKSLPGYLHIPTEVPADDKYGLLVILNGASSSKEETLTWAGPFMRAGLAVLALDSPGNGEAASTPYSGDQDDILDGVFDLLAADPRLNLAQVLVLGVSLGGNQAIRCAAYDRRIAGVITVTPPVEPNRWIERISPLLGADLAMLLGNDPSSTAALCRQLDLRSVLPRISCPVLVIGAGRDVVVPSTESQRLAEALGPIATLLWFGQSGHCAYDQIVTWTGDVARWSAAILNHQADATRTSVRTDRAASAKAIAIAARETLLTSPVIEQVTWEDTFDEGARLLTGDEILDDDPDWYRPDGAAPSKSDTSQARGSGV